MYIFLTIRSFTLSVSNVQSSHIATSTTSLFLRTAQSSGATFRMGQFKRYHKRFVHPPPPHRHIISSTHSSSIKLSRSPAQILLRWSIQHGFVPLPKSSKPARVVENARLYDFELGEEDMRALDEEDRGDTGAISWNPVNAD